MGRKCNRYRVSFWGNENILEFDVIVEQHCEYTQNY